MSFRLEPGVLVRAKARFWLGAVEWRSSQSRFGFREGSNIVFFPGDTLVFLKSINDGVKNWHFFLKNGKMLGGGYSSPKQGNDGWESLIEIIV